MSTIKFTLEGLKQSFNYIEKEKDYINIDDILLILQKREIQKNEVEFIKYLNTEYNAWDSIKDNEKLQLNKEKDLKILIKIKKRRKVQNEELSKKKEELMKKMDKIDKEIDEILINESKKNNKSKKNDKSKKNNKSKEEELALYPPNIRSNSSLSISETPESETAFDSFFINSEIDKVDIIILTGNPLIDTYDGYKKELRTMNDFNYVTHSIHKVILDCNKPIFAKFLPLTLKNFNDSILLRPKILHLICKSTYLSNRSKNEMNKNDNIINEKEIFSPYLLFENEKCEMERINEEGFKKMMNLLIKTKGGEGLLRDISLFISTPLAQDIFGIVNQFQFKNIIVQHTVYTNVPFIAELNKQFYNIIIESDKSIEESFDLAQNINTSKEENIIYQSCCCFHSHLNNCELRSNLSNELYNEDENDNEKQNKEDYIPLPHFYHLRYKCICKNLDFCNHNRKSCNNYHNTLKKYLLEKYPEKNKKKKIKIKDILTICCCELKNNLHDINKIFFTKFSDKKEGYGLFLNYQSNNFSTIDKVECVPNYDKMDLIVGRNKIIYNIFKSLMDNNVEIINIYGPRYKESITMIDTFIVIIIEFLKERMTSDSNKNVNIKDDSSDILQDMHSSEIFNNFNSSDNQIEIDMKKVESAPLSLGRNNNNPTFEIIAIRKDFQENTFTIINEIANDNKKKVYFINAFNIDDDVIQEKLKRKEFIKKQIIVFTKNKLGKINEKSIKHIELKNLTKTDYIIKLQRDKILNSKESYEKCIDKKIKENYINEEEEFLNRSTVYKDNEKANLIYEILFLFNCSICGHFEKELEKLFDNNIAEVKQILNQKYIPKNIIEIENIVEDKKIVFKYCRKNQVFKVYYEIRKNNIPDTVKQKVFQRLFKFYSMVFRLIIKEAKNKFQIKGGDIKIGLKKKYKPLDSLTTFSAIQELGIWESFEKNYQDDNLVIYDIVGYFNHLLKNFSNIFKNENIILCYKKKEIWETVSNDIEDISITLPTCLKIFSIENDKLISLLKDQLKQLDRYLHSSLARLELFDYMSFEFTNHNIKHIEKLNEIEQKFLEYGYMQGILETLFAKCIVKYRESNDFKEFDNEKLKKELSDFENDKNYIMENKSRFIKLFKNKIKYLYYKYKIKGGVLSEEDLSELKEILKTFKNEKKWFYAIKVCFLFSEWHLKKYNLEKRDGKAECQKEKDKYFEYLNFAYYISVIDIYQKYLDYTKDLIQVKYNIKNPKPSKDMKDKIKNLCTEYKFDFKEDSLKTYYIE